MLTTAEQNVVLEVVGGVNGGYGPAKLEFSRNLPNGERDGGPEGIGWRIPAGQALVITDVDWQYIHPEGAAGAGRIQILRLFIESLDKKTMRPSVRVFESTITLSARGEGGISESMATGFVVSSKARVCPDIFPGPGGPPFGLQHLILRGYLIQDASTELNLSRVRDVSAALQTSRNSALLKK